MNKFLKHHWRIIIPIILMLIIFWFSANSSCSSNAMSKPIADFFGLPHAVVRKTAHFILFALLGASWYYYLRTLGRFTPGFTSLGSFSLTLLYSLLDEFHQTFVEGRTGLMSDVFIDASAAIAGIAVIATIYYLTRTKEQRQARRKQVDKIWADNDKLIKKLKKSPKPRKK